MTLLSTDEYRKLLKHRKEERQQAQVQESVKNKPGKLDTVAAIKAFANYFELDAKQTNFWIKQMKLSGKI